MIEVKNLSGGYSADDPIVKGLNFDIQQGEFFGLLGPNGSGKTTLFKLITGTLPLTSGEILLDNTSLFSLSKLEKARKIAVLTQESHVSFDFTVEEIVSLGRYAFQKGILKSLSKYDKNIISDVMELANVTQYRFKQFRLLSGGEKQRVLLAKALAQEPLLLLLDEPTNHLDIKHSLYMLDLLKEWQRTKQLTIFSILHDINIAALYADRIALLHEGTFLDIGEVEVLRKKDQLNKLYEVDIRTQSHPKVPKPQILMTPRNEVSVTRMELGKAYQMKQNDDFIHLEFDQPLRTISNGVVGEGIQWVKHYCNFHVDKNYDCSSPKEELEGWMRDNGIPPEQAVGMMTAVQLKYAVVRTAKIENIQFITVVTAGVGNAVDISQEGDYEREYKIGTINTMVFVDAHLTDGALVNACMSATEAKTKALSDLKVKDPFTNTIATSTSTDSLLIGVTQQGEATPYAGSGTFVGKGIGRMVYEATREAIESELKRKI
ncbi:adenosylcobinamide amidohydrolase [Salipaludibacillus sp. CF4.18]|uniref:adenosylcobinamide amidohydrolase n=1 Tax=Salipaludibacillus sp. CF4.18 TaxID=3373081 RepID=UPI003EE51AB6